MKALFIFAIVVLLAVILGTFFALNPAFLGNSEQIVTAKYCTGSSVHVFKCDNGFFEARSLPDLPFKVINGSGSLLATCGGFIQNSFPPECQPFKNLNCNLSQDLCSK